MRSFSNGGISPPNKWDFRPSYLRLLLWLFLDAQSSRRYRFDGRNMPSKEKHKTKDQKTQNGNQESISINFYSLQPI